MTDDDVTNFYAAISGNFEGAVQYNKDNRAFEVTSIENIYLNKGYFANKKIMPQIKPKKRALLIQM